MQTQSMQNFEHFEFSIPREKKEIIEALKGFMSAFKKDIKINHHNTLHNETNDLKANSKVEVFRELTGFIKADRLPTPQERQNAKVSRYAK